MILCLVIWKKVKKFSKTGSIGKGGSLGGRPRIAKNIGIQYKGEYKILTEPYKGFPDEGRGEPCVHPALSDSLLGKAENGFFIKEIVKFKKIVRAV